MERFPSAEDHHRQRHTVAFEVEMDRGLLSASAAVKLNDLEPSIAGISDRPRESLSISSRTDPGAHQTRHHKLVLVLTVGEVFPTLRGRIPQRSGRSRRPPAGNRRSMIAPVLRSPAFLMGEMVFTVATSPSFLSQDLSQISGVPRREPRRRPGHIGVLGVCDCALVFTVLDVAVIALPLRPKELLPQRIGEAGPSEGPAAASRNISLWLSFCLGSAKSIKRRPGRALRSGSRFPRKGQPANQFRLKERRGSFLPPFHSGPGELFEGKRGGWRRRSAGCRGAYRAHRW